MKKFATIVLTLLIFHQGSCQITSKRDPLDNSSQTPIKSQDEAITVATREAYSNMNSSMNVTGWYGGKVRRVFNENGQLYLQRGTASKLTLETISEDLYKMVFDVPVMHE